MARKNENRQDPLTQGQGRTDEVDQSRGIFPLGVPHPEGAEIRPAGAIGGGPYDESGRGGVEVTFEHSSSDLVDRLPATGPTGEEAPQGERAEEKEPKGALPPHEQGKK
jgi:hypothetical protein